MSEDTRNGKIGIAAAPGSAMKRAGNSGDENVFGKLFDLANATAGKLEALWDEVGCSAEDRKEHLQGGWEEWREAGREGSDRKVAQKARRPNLDCQNEILLPASFVHMQKFYYHRLPLLPQFFPPSLPPIQTGLVVDFERLCQEKVREEESVRDQFQTNIAQLQQEVVELTARLGVSDGRAGGREGGREERKKEVEGRVYPHGWWEHLIVVQLLVKAASFPPCPLHPPHSLLPTLPPSLPPPLPQKPSTTPSPTRASLSGNGSNNLTDCLAVLIHSSLPPSLFPSLPPSLPQKPSTTPYPTRASLSGNGSNNLTDRLADLEETVEELRAQKEGRLQSLRAAREK